MIPRTLLLLLASLAIAPSSQAEDTDDLRGHLGVRLGISAAYDTDVGGGPGPCCARAIRCSTAG